MSNFDKLLSGSTIRFTVFVLLPSLIVLILLPIEILAGGGTNDPSSNTASTSTTHRQGPYTAPPQGVRDPVTGSFVQQDSAPNSLRAGMRRQLGHVAPANSSNRELNNNRNNRWDPVNANKQTTGQVQAGTKTGPQVVREQTKVLSKQKQQEIRQEKEKQSFANAQMKKALEDPRSRRTAIHIPASSPAGDKISNLPGLPGSKSTTVKQSAVKPPGAAHVPSNAEGSAIPVRANSRMAKKLTGSPAQQGPTKASPSTTRIIANPSNSSTVSNSKNRLNVDQFGKNFKGNGK